MQRDPIGRHRLRAIVLHSTADIPADMGYEVPEAGSAQEAFTLPVALF